MIDTHPNPEQYLKLQLGRLCIAYFIESKCDDINQEYREKVQIILTEFNSEKLCEIIYNTNNYRNN